MRVLFFHGETTDGRRFTVAGNYETDRIKIGISITSSNDAFCKKVGRIRSEGRMKSNPAVSPGVISHGLYSSDYYKDVDTPKDWFKGKELSVFLEYVRSLEGYDARELQRIFRLDNR